MALKTANTARVRRGWLRQRLPAAEPVIAPTPADPDPNARYVFRPAPAGEAATAVVTLDALYHLSRSL